MLGKSTMGAVALTLTAMIADAQAWDETRYPDLKGQWVRGYPGLSRFDPAKPIGPRQEAPLTPEYQAIFEANVKEQAAGGQGTTKTYRCFSPGKPASSAFVAHARPRPFFCFLSHSGFWLAKACQPSNSSPSLGSG